MKCSPRFLTSAVAVLPILVASAPALAGGFAVARFGGEHGHSATDHVTAIYYNPAGLSLGSGIRVYAEGLFGFRSVDYTRNVAGIDNQGAGTPDDAVGANSGKASLGNAVVSPFVGAAAEIGAGFAIGLGLYVPFGGQASWDKAKQWEGNADYPGAVDGPQRWAAIEGEQRSTYFTIGAAWATRDKKLAFGATVSAVQTTMSLVRARNLDGSDDLVAGTGDERSVAEGRSLLEGDDVTYAASVGAMVQVTPCARVGVAYLSQPGFGGMTVEGTLTNKFGRGSVTEAPIVLTQELPDSVRLGAEWHAFQRAALRAGVEYTRWSTFRDQCIIGKTDGAKCVINPDGSEGAGGVGPVLVNVPRNWDDTILARIGGSWWPTDDLEVNAGASYDSNAVPDETLETALIDADKAIATVGGAWGTTPWHEAPLTIEATVGFVHYFERTTEPRAADPASPSRNPDMAGTYKQEVVYALLGVALHI